MSMLKWIDKINSPEDLKKIPQDQLPEVCQEYRQHLIESVAQTGGHLGASLGALELNVALHYVLESPKDKICWDVGHQAYIHKMITGRREKMPTLRQHHGISGFPSPFENKHDHFIVGHAGTAISQALGLAAARDLQKQNEKVVAVVGDGSLTSGLAYEALNNAGHLKKKMVIILNDNEMSISKNVGAISRYLNKMLTNPLYNRVRTEVEKQLDKFPRVRRLANVSLEGMKHLLVPGILFEELGLRYIGPIDGHDVKTLVATLKSVTELNDCVLLHVITQKGKGYKFAEEHIERLHGVTPFNVATGEKVKSPNEAQKTKEEGIPFTKAFVNALKRVAAENPKVVAITAAMPSGTGLDSFQKEFPDRFFDVGIAEQHAVTFAGALAKGGMRPVCAIYSTFLQRGFDSVVHDVALQRQPVIFCMDRAGLVGADGATHNGVFDISFLGVIPQMVIGSPMNENEIEQMLCLALKYPHAFAIRYPRGNIPKICESFAQEPFKIGEGQHLADGEDGTLLALGTMVETAFQARELLLAKGIRVGVVNMRFAQPLDGELILDCLKRSPYLFTVEEHVLNGGFGSKVLEFLERHQIQSGTVERFALPDQFIEHGSKDLILDQFGLSAEKIAARIEKKLQSKKSVGT